MSPTQRTLAWLKKLGRRAAVVEKWNPHARIRQDLFGVIDVVSLGGEITGIQATSGANVAARIAKMLDEKQEPAVRDWLLSGGKLEVHGWRKAGPRGKRKLWELRRVVVALVNNRLTVEEHT